MPKIRPDIGIKYFTFKKRGKETKTTKKARKKRHKTFRVWNKK